MPNSLEELQKQVATPATTKTEKKTTSEKLAKDIFTLTTLEGKELHVDETNGGIGFQGHENRVTFLLFFGFRCPPCLAEIPALVSLTKEQHKDLDIIAIEVQRLPAEDLKAFKKMKGINYTLLSGDEGENAQFISYIGKRAQWSGSIPFLVALNPKDAKSWFRLAHAHNELGNCEAAQNAAREAVDRKKNFGGGWYELGIAEWCKGDG